MPISLANMTNIGGGNLELHWKLQNIFHTFNLSYNVMWLSSSSWRMGKTKRHVFQSKFGYCVQCPVLSIWTVLSLHVGSDMIFVKSLARNLQRFRPRLLNFSHRIGMISQFTSWNSHILPGLNYLKLKRRSINAKLYPSGNYFYQTC